MKDSANDIGGLKETYEVPPSQLRQFWRSRNCCQSDFKIQTEVTKEGCFTLQSFGNKHTLGNFVPSDRDDTLCVCMYVCVQPV